MAKKKNHKKSMGNHSHEVQINGVLLSTSSVNRRILENLDIVEVIVEFHGLLNQFLFSVKLTYFTSKKNISSTHCKVLKEKFLTFFQS